MSGDVEGAPLSGPINRVMSRARLQAVALGHPFVCEEHLLLGLLETKDTVGGHALSQVGVTLDAFRDRFLELAQPEMRTSMNLAVVSSEQFQKELSREGLHVPDPRGTELLHLAMISEGARYGDYRIAMDELASRDALPPRYPVATAVDRGVELVAQDLLPTPGLSGILERASVIGREAGRPVADSGDLLIAQWEANGMPPRLLGTEWGITGDALTAELRAARAVIEEAEVEE